MNFSAQISKMFGHWNGASRKGRMSPLPTLDPAITQSVLLNTYSAANHDENSIAGGRHGMYIITNCRK